MGNINIIHALDFTCDIYEGSSIKNICFLSRESTSGVGISMSYRYYRYTLAYWNIGMYFEYHNIFWYFFENWKKDKLNKVERRNIKFKKQRPKFCQIKEQLDNFFFKFLVFSKFCKIKKLHLIVFIILLNFKNNFLPF